MILKIEIRNRYYKLYNKCCNKYLDHTKVNNISIGEYCEKQTIKEVSEYFNITPEEVIIKIGEDNLRQMEMNEGYL